MKRNKNPIQKMYDKIQKAKKCNECQNCIINTNNHKICLYNISKIWSWNFGVQNCNYYKKKEPKNVRNRKESRNH